jgi:hypothetical protein
MTLDEGRAFLEEFAGGWLPAMGFERAAPLVYSRAENDAVGSLVFPFRVDSKGSCCFGCNVWLRFDSLELLLRGDTSKRPTVSMPLHLIGRNRNFTEWQFNEGAGLASLKEIVASDINDLARPFIAQYSGIPELRKRLESPNPSDWFVLGPEERVTTLAASLFVQGDKVAALRRLDDALVERRSALPKKRLPIEAVRRRLAEIG